MEDLQHRRRRDCGRALRDGPRRALRREQYVGNREIGGEVWYELLGICREARGHRPLGLLGGALEGDAVNHRERVAERRGAARRTVRQAESHAVLREGAQLQGIAARPLSRVGLRPGHGGGERLGRQDRHCAHLRLIGRAAGGALSPQTQPRL